ncbi:hypothetical protein [Parasedimentitalea huanghaiensis]|uniref:Uncharacterized protein n=1 Tax=Parasedimentitalea huanghaiensis TaxID=2682100 RepID=A0A6L6WKV8_9RHOB|nr:hypothetical protein [Zongyanglinia huanghaiensis]MVO18020.1 hypothetical protein [Zongyanglinia huanghaiensis]
MANNEQFSEQLSLEQALKHIQTSPPIRKIKEMLDRTELSADTKALLYDVAKVTVKIGETVVAVGRRIIDIAYKLVTKFPNTTFAAIVAVVLTTLCTGTIGALIPALAVALNKLIFLLGIAAGAIEDLRQNAMKNAMERVAMEFAALQG